MLARAYEPSVVDLKPLARAARLELTSMEAQPFLRLARRAAFDEAAGGWVGSQYEAQLLARDPSVGVWALVGCDQVFGAMSWGIHELPRGGVSGRIDLVVTEPRQRGRGVARIVMAHFISETERRFGDELRHVSVIAQHPAIGHCVKQWGLQAADCGNAPMFQVDLQGTGRGAFFTTVRRDLHDRLGTLKHGCLRCRKHAWVTPWCAEGEAA